MSLTSDWSLENGNSCGRSEAGWRASNLLPKIQDGRQASALVTAKHRENTEGPKNGSQSDKPVYAHAVQFFRERGWFGRLQGFSSSRDYNLLYFDAAGTNICPGIFGPSQPGHKRDGPVENNTHGIGECGHAQIPMSSDPS